MAKNKVRCQKISSLFLRKRLLFCRASVFIFGRSSYLTALESLIKQKLRQLWNMKLLIWNPLICIFAYQERACSYTYLIADAYSTAGSTLESICYLNSRLDIKIKLKKKFIQKSAFITHWHFLITSIFQALYFVKDCVQFFPLFIRVVCRFECPT